MRVERTHRGKPRPWDPTQFGRSSGEYQSNLKTGNDLVIDKSEMWPRTTTQTRPLMENTPAAAVADGMPDPPLPLHARARFGGPFAMAR